MSGTGITVYANAAWIPERAQMAGRPTVAAPQARPAAPVVRVRTPGAPIVRDARPVLPGPAAATSYRGPLAVGTVFTALAPADRWNLAERTGRPRRARSPFGWAGRYQVTEAGTSTLAFDGGPSTPLSLLYSIIAWLAAIAVVAAPGLGGSWRRVRTGRRRPWGGTAPTAPTGTVGDDVDGGRHRSNRSAEAEAET